MKIARTAFFGLTAWMSSFALLLGSPQELDQKLKEIQALVAPDEADPPQVAREKLRVSHAMQNFEAAIKSARPEDLRQLAQQALAGGGIPTLGEKVNDLLKIALEELDRRDKAQLAEVETLTREISDALLSAEKPEDLDEVLKRLSEVIEEAKFRQSPKWAQARQQMDSVRQIVNQWQDYLIARAAGNENLANGNLRQISTMLGTTPLVPRSRVLRMMLGPTGETKADDGAPAPTPDGILERLSQTGDIAAAAEAIERVPRTEQNQRVIDPMTKKIKGLETLMQVEPAMTEREVMAHIRNLNMQSGQDLALQRAFEKISLISISRNFDVEVPPADEISSHKLLESIASTAAREGNWARLRRALQALEDYMIGSHMLHGSHRISIDIKITSLIGLGEAAEERGDLRTAVSAYLDAIALEGMLLSRDVPFRQLADLKARLPEQVQEIETEVRQEERMAKAIRAEARELIHQQPVTPLNLNDPAALRKELKPLVQEVVAEFLQGRRTEAAAKSQPSSPEIPEQPATPEKPHPGNLNPEH